MTFLFSVKANASVQTLFIDCSNGCVKSGIDPLFSLAIDGYWYPGRTLTKIINLKNSSTLVKEMAMRALRTSPPSDLEDVISIEILNTKTGTIVWTGKLRDFYNQNKIVMGMFNLGTNINYNFKVSMDVNAGNHYQGLESVFNLTLGFWPEEPNDFAVISGFKYFDLNSNNKWDGWTKGEYKIDGWMIFIDKNNNKKFDWGERFDITSGFSPLPEGKYSFDKLYPGTYNICEIQLPMFEASLPNHSVCQQTIISNGENKTGISFGNHFISKKK